MRAVEQRGLRRAGVEQGAKRTIQHWRKNRCAAIDRIAKHRLVLDQLLRHAGVLRALAGEQERQACRIAAHHTRGPHPFIGHAICERLQAAAQLDHRTDKDRSAIWMRGA